MKKLRLKRRVKEELIFIGFMIPMFIFEWLVLLKIFQ